MPNNETFVPTYDSCDEVSDLCPIELTIYGTYLSKGAAYFFAIAFAVCFLLQVYFGIRARTWSFLIWLGLGTGFEVIGYWARTRLADNPWSLNSFIIQYLTLLLAPTLVAAAISVTFKSIVLWYGPQWSPLRPSLYPWVFVGTDFLSIFIQIIGGAASAANATGNGSETTAKLGEALVIGGVAFQVANMLVCGGLMLLYTTRRRSDSKKGVGLLESERHPEGGSVSVGSRSSIPMSRSTATDQQAKRVRWFIYALAVAYVAIIIRCAYRIAEQIPSISIDVLRNEPLFLVFDGAMLLVSIALISFLHPYNFFPYLGVKTKARKQFEQNGGFPMRPVQYQSGGAHAAPPQRPPRRQMGPQQY